MRDYELPRNFNIKGLSLIDVTSEDDCLITSPLHSHTSEISLDCFDECGKLDGKIEEGERRGNGRQKLHKSMTWDSCFFDTEDFLEPEEFSGQEDVNRSRGSLTMLPGEALRQEDLKADFGEDIRASIQKSKRVPGNAGPSVKKELETKGSRIVSSSKKLENSNLDRVKQKAAPKKPNIATKEPGKTMKQVPARSQTSQPVGRSGVSTSSLHKTSKLMDRRDSLGAKDAKSVTGRRTTISKTPALDGSRNVVPRTTPSSRSSSLSSSMICNSSMDMIKQNKYPSLVKSSSSGYTTTNASKSAAECKSRAGRSAVSTLLKSPIKLHSSMSVACSDGDWSSVSSLSSSTSTANKRPNVLRASLGSGSGSHKGLLIDSDARRVSDFQSSHLTRRNSLGGGAEDTGSLDESENKVLDIKRTGLRPPSPKPHSSNGLRSRHTRTRSVGAATTGMSKTGAKSTNPSGGSNKAPPRTLQQSTSAARKVRSASRNPKISPGMPSKLENKPSQKTGRESYSKAQGIGSAEKIAGSDKPKLVVKLRGKDGARIKDTKRSSCSTGLLK